ncbi:hypothetical protein ACYOEI_41970, partial [Singulisphaera rosea]
APMHRPPPAPVKAVIVTVDRQEVAPPSLGSRADNDSRWLIPFIAIAVLLGVLAILAITLIR